MKHPTEYFTCEICQKQYEDMEMHSEILCKYCWCKLPISLGSHNVERIPLILRELSKKELNTREISELWGLSITNVYFILRKLKREEKIKVVRRNGQVLYYRTTKKGEKSIENFESKREELIRKRENDSIRII